MEPIPSNTNIFSPRGFVPHVRDPAVVADVVGGSVWGADDVARLRTAGLVRVGLPQDGERTVLSGPRVSPETLAKEKPGGERPERRPTTVGRLLGDDDLVLRTVLWLALAGVPVTGAGLPGAVRDRLDPDLLALVDRVAPDTVADPGSRELLSLALRRRARELTGHPPADLQPGIAVLLPEEELPATLAADLERQTWTRVVPIPAAPEDEAQVLAGAREEGAVYCTRMAPSVRYGPHHLADLVAALRHSGARAAHSPLRFRPWREGSWLEDEAAAVEGAAAGGLEHGSLWYAVDGPEAPVVPDDGYAVHGVGAVPAPGTTEEVDDDRAVALRLHPGLPPVLDWLDHEEGTSTTHTRSAPESYFARPGAPSRARSSSTASES